MCHVSCVMCQVSYFCIYLFLYLFIFGKVFEIIGSWYVINGAYPVYFWHGQDPEDQPWPSRTLYLGGGIKHDTKPNLADRCLIYLDPLFFFFLSLNIFWTPYKVAIMGATRGCFWPLWPPLWAIVWGGQSICLGGYHWLTLIIPMDSNFCGELLASNIMLVILGEYPNLQISYPPRLL